MGRSRAIKIAVAQIEDQGLALQPSEGSGMDDPAHQGEEGGIVLIGRLEVTVGEERRILGPGDAYYFKSHRPHRFRCIGRIRCEVVSACTPPTF